MSLRRFTGWSIWGLAGLFGPLVLLIGSRKPVGDNSYLWHVVAGRVQHDTGAVITHDPFSFTALGEPWRTQSWLADLAYGILDDGFGLEAPRWIPVVVGGVFFLFVWLLIREHLPAGLLAAAVNALTALVLLPFLNPRPVIFSYLLLAAVVLAVRRPRLWWTIPLLTWLWASVHGSFVLVGVVVGLEWIATRRHRLLVVGLVSGFVSLLTAHGIGAVEILLSFASSGEALDRINEWQPPDLVSPPLWPVIAALAIVFAGGTRPTPGRGFMLLAWLVFGLTANRSVPLAWVALLPTIAAAAAHWSGRWEERARLPAPVIVVTAAAILAAPLLVPPQPGLLTERFPVVAAGALTQERVFHDDGAGGYLIYAQWPERKVYIDDRAELYGAQYVAFTDAHRSLPGWDEELERWGIGEALLRVDTALRQTLLAAGWLETYADDDFVVLRAP